MRLQTLTFLFSLVVFVLATGNLQDKADIKDAISQFDLDFDKKEYNKLGNVLAKNVTLEVTGEPPIQGPAAVIKFISEITPNDTVSDSIASNQLIKFLPPFDNEGRSDRAEAISSSTIFFFHVRNSTRAFYGIFARFEDKFIRTREPGLGGWRFEHRNFKEVGEIGDRNLLGK